jgi:hypothetical protein
MTGGWLLERAGGWLESCERGPVTGIDVPSGMVKRSGMSVREHDHKSAHHHHVIAASSAHHQRAAR